MIYFCIPSHDEAPTIGLVLWKIRRVLEDSPREYQLLVGDDASTDATTEILAQYTKVLPLTVLRSDRRLGYAGTVERLLREALRRSDRHKRDVAILLPGDFASDPADLSEFLRRIDSGADVIVGEAAAPASADRWRRRVREWAPALLGRRARVAGVRDVVSGFLAFRLVALRNAFHDRPEAWLTTEGWAANAQLLSWAAAGARRVESVAVIERDRQVRPSRHRPWDRARALWSARGQLTRVPDELPTERPTRPGARSGKEAA
jgi:glycosyltransferase involved in cell wall biosynthesis